MNEITNDLNKFPKYKYKKENNIPENGIYILYEKINNKYEIVRIGSHTGENNFKKRLKEHFETENKDRSIFRKNIGRAYLNIWNKDFKLKKNKKRIQ